MWYFLAEQNQHTVEEQVLSETFIFMQDSNGNWNKNYNVNLMKEDSLEANRATGGKEP